VHQASYDTGRFLAREIARLGPFELLCESDPLTSIPSVTWRIKEGSEPGFSLFDLADRLRVRGWQVPAYTLTGDVSDVAVQRILVRQGVTRDLASILLGDLKDAIAHFGAHPVTVGMRAEEAGGFNHL
jgi:glutamate decarboxylase